MAQRPSSKLFTRTASLTPSTFDANRRSVGLVWSTGAPVTRFDFEGPFTERLDMSLDAVDLSQLNGAPVLNSHNRFDVREILGTVLDPSVDGTRGTATVRFSSRPDVEPVIKDVADGVISRVSVGYSVQRWASSKDAAGNRSKTAVRWTPAEISFTAIGADPGARTRAVTVEVEDNAGAADELEPCDCDPATDPDCNCEDQEEEPMTKAAVPDQVRSAGRLLGIRGDFVESLATRDGIDIQTARSELLAAPRSSVMNATRSWTVC